MDGGPLHDPTVTAYLLKPELFTGRQVNVEISCDQELTRGMTWSTGNSVTSKPKNALVLTEIDADGYFDLVIETPQRRRARTERSPVRPTAGRADAGWSQAVLRQERPHSPPHLIEVGEQGDMFAIRHGEKLGALDL